MNIMKEFMCVAVIVAGYFLSGCAGQVQSAEVNSPINGVYLATYVERHGGTCGNRGPDTVVFRDGKVLIGDNFLGTQDGDNFSLSYRNAELDVTMFIYFSSEYSANGSYSYKSSTCGSSYDVTLTEKPKLVAECNIEHWLPGGVLEKFAVVPNNGEGFVQATGATGEVLELSISTTEFSAKCATQA